MSYSSNLSNPSISSRKVDWVPVFLYLLIVCFGWVNIYAACYDDVHTAVFDFSVQHGKQLIWVATAFVLAIVVLYVEPRFFVHTAYPFYGLLILLLVATFFIGTATNGGLSWINFGAFKFQPSEFAKLATALALAKFMSTIDLDIHNSRTWKVVALILGIPMLLVLLQHDTGSALVFLSLLIPLYREGMPSTILLVGFAAIVLFVLALVINKFVLIGIIFAVCLAYLFLWLNKRYRRNYVLAAAAFVVCSLFVLSVDFAFEHVLESHQRDRIYVLLGKTDDIKSVGYNVYQSKIAIGSGGFLGKGFLDGSITKADFVPEQETDFIFCTVGEEWGFAGSSLLIATYVALLLYLVAMAERQRSTFARFYGYCIISILFFHLCVNVGMVLGLVPVIGIPLPFFSYGGSSLLAFTLMLFIFIRQDAEKFILL